MACTIDATVGGVAANSYASIADGDAYHEVHLYAETWDDASDDEKCRALQMATRQLDTWYEWNGEVASGDQALLWPRGGAIGPSGYLFASDELPALLVNATSELARQLLSSDRTADSDIEAQGLKSLKAGSVEMAFGSVSSKPIPDAVAAMCSLLGVKRNSGGGAVTLRRA